MYLKLYGKKLQKYLMNTENFAIKETCFIQKDIEKGTV